MFYTNDIQKKAYFKYIIALLLFGSNGIVANHIDLPSEYIVLFRTLIGSILLIMLFRITKCRFSFYKNPKDCIFLCISGIAMGASWMFLYEAYDQIGVSIASLLYYCGPVIVMALSPILFKEKLTVATMVGFFVVICGVILVNGQSLEKLNVWGISCGCLSAVMYSFMIISNKKSETIVGMENSLIQIFVSFLTVAVFVGLRNKGYTMNIELTDWVWIFLLGLLNTGIGCYFYFSSIGDLPVQSVAIYGYLEPLSALLFSMIFLKETLRPLQLAGAAFIIAGAIFGEQYGRRKS